jgi:hypothetical protein
MHGDRQQEQHTHMHDPNDPQAGNVNIGGLEKAAVLVALFHAAGPTSTGALTLSIDEARSYMAKRADWRAGRPLYVDSLKGRPIRCDIGGDWLDPRLFDRDLGEGAAAHAIAELREHGVPTKDAVSEHRPPAPDAPDARPESRR